MSTLLQATCLQSKYSLRRQLFQSFGATAILTLSVVVVVATIVGISAGNLVQERSSALLREQVFQKAVETSQHTAESFAERMTNLEGNVQLMEEMVQSRIVGYPNDGWEDDIHVPFPDIYSGMNRYPLQGPPLTLDWQIYQLANINASNAVENFQERAPWAVNITAHSRGPSLAIQGSCDPNETDTLKSTYAPNCTEANNNLATGGVVQPTSTCKGLSEKAADVGMLLKPLFEAEPTIRTMGCFFANSGAGLSMFYPSIVAPRRTPRYNSSGCDWMREINPYTGEPYATDEEIARCHPKGTSVPQNEYNPMERDWARVFTLAGEKVTWYGPLKAFETGAESILIGSPVFDRRTGHFLGCVSIQTRVSDLQAFLIEAKLNNFTNMAVISVSDGYILADTMSSIAQAESFPITAVDAGVIASVTFEKISKIFDFSQEWTQDQVRAAYADNIFPCIRGFVTAYPLPLPPDEYDPNYRPDYFFIHVISYDVLEVINDLEHAINQDTMSLLCMSTSIAVVGMVIILAIVWCVSVMLTRPLLWIESLSWEIVNHSDKTEPKSLQLVPDNRSSRATLQCTPTTEITLLVMEFERMIRGFSGSGASSVAQAELYEVRNEMTWQSAYSEFYAYAPPWKKPFHSNQTPRTDGTPTTEEASKECEADCCAAPESNEPPPGEVEDHCVCTIVPAPPKKNRGSNTAKSLHRKRFFYSKLRLIDHLNSYEIRPHRSSLFWWILVLIVLPLLLTSAAICAIVSFRLVAVVPSWVDIVEVESTSLEIESLAAFATIKASYAEMNMHQVARDLHLLTRTAGWVLFGGLKGSGSFTDIAEATEDCKNSPLPVEDNCPYFKSNNTPCACEWHDTFTTRTCTSYGEEVARALQRGFFLGQVRDADPITGSRPICRSFPEFDYSPDTTLWWNNVTELPGSEEGSNSSGFGTTYGRVKLASTLNVVFMPVYDYAPELRRRTHDLGTYMAFEEDGIFSGTYGGCDYSFARMAYFVSSTDNRAAEIAPTLCPIGKYGYDPRCRDWYATGKKKYNATGVDIHVTSPYEFAGKDHLLATSATAPLVNPQTGVYVGQMLLDFHQSGTLSALNTVNTTLSFAITLENDVTGGDTVIGPNKTALWKSVPISDLVMENDAPGSPNRVFFDQQVLSRMKNGESGIVDFSRTQNDGSTESLTMAFAPVPLRFLHALDPSDYSRGVNLSNTIVYSIGLANSQGEVRMPFQQIQDSVYTDLGRLRIIYAMIVFFVCMLFAIFSCTITLYVTKPILTLLIAVQTINAGQVEGDIPPLQAGSREMYQVYNSFAKLYKIVRISNVAFFSGNLHWAYHFISDALKLFRKVKDEKAVGVACNNLGNTLYGMIHDSLRDGTHLILKEEKCVVTSALAYFDEAILIAQQGFDEAEGVESKAEFAQQLADRLFNRGLFLLLSRKTEHPVENAKERALQDIARTRDLDRDVREFWLARKLLLRNSAECFNRLVRRLHGLVDYYEDADLQETWDAKELALEADKLLFAAWEEPSAPLFEKLTRVGRLQELEGAVIRLDLCTGRKPEAARLAMRMFAEDEYLLETSFLSAAKAILRLARDEDSAVAWSEKTRTTARSDIRRMFSSCKHISLDIGKCLVFALEINEVWEGDPLLERINVNCLKLYDECCASDDHMGVVAYTTRGDLNVKLGMKSANETKQRASLDLATTSTSERGCPSLPYAMQILVDSSASSQKDSYILLITDGEGWDPVTYAATKSQIERLNRERNTSINIFVLGLELDDQPEILDDCKMLSSISKRSFYIDLTLDNVDTTFDLIARAITGRGANYFAFPGITMEKF